MKVRKFNNSTEGVRRPASGYVMGDQMFETVAFRQRVTKSREKARAARKARRK